MSSRSARLSTGTITTRPSGVMARTPWQASARLFKSTESDRWDASSSSGIVSVRNARTSLATSPEGPVIFFSTWPYLMVTSSGCPSVESRWLPSDNYFHFTFTLVRHISFEVQNIPARCYSLQSSGQCAPTSMIVSELRVLLGVTWLQLIAHLTCAGSTQIAHRGDEIGLSPHVGGALEKCTRDRLPKLECNTPSRGVAHFTPNRSPAAGHDQVPVW
jgi:hypothetical protein